MILLEIFLISESELENTFPNNHFKIIMVESSLIEIFMNEVQFSILMKYFNLTNHENSRVSQTNITEFPKLQCK